MFTFKRGCTVPYPEKISEGYEETENGYIANISIEKTIDVIKSLYHTSFNINIEGGEPEPTWNFTQDYETELTRVINKVKGYQDDKSKYNTSFIVFTDCHTNTTSAHPELDRMLQAINYLTRNLDIKFVANLGDTVNNPGTSGSMDVYPYIINYLKGTKAPYINLMGNHDWVGSVYKRNYATNIENASFDKVGSWFYVDDNNNDIRYICLDCQDRGNDANAWTTVTTTSSGVTDRSWQQLDWLANVALKTQKRVVILEHQSLGSSQSDVVASTTNTANYFLAKDLLSAFENGVSGTLNYTTYYPAETTAHSTISYDFTEQGAGRLLCCLEGHTHGDMDWSYSGISSYPTPFNEIWFDDALCNSQTYIGKANTKTINTVNEIAFDVVTLDLINEKVYCTRFGTGDDRELTLRASQGIPVTAITVNAETSYNATTFTPTATLTPSNTTQTGITWSITSGGTYASINSSTGVVTVNSGASSNSITVKATSTANSSVYGTKNITVTYPTEPVPLTALAINAESSYTGIEFTPTVTYTPSNTTQTGVTWSITSGGEYATINSSTGVVTIDDEADSDSITITATSTENSSITATKNVTVTYEADVDITSEFTFTSGGPAGYAAGWAFDDSNNPYMTGHQYPYPGTNANLARSNFVNIEGYTSLTMTNITRASATASGGWAFYGSNDITDTVSITPLEVPYKYINTAPAQFIQDGASSRNHNSTQDGVQTDTVQIPAGAKYIRVTYWANNGATYNTPFSCVAHR